MASFPLGKYRSIDSFFHKLDARIKLFSMVLLMIMLFIKLNNVWMDFTFYAFMIIFVLIVMKISKITIKSLLKVIKPMWFMMLFLFVVNIFAIKSGNLIFSWNFINIYDESLYMTIYTFIRIILMLSFSLILTSTTKPMDLTYALEWYLYPLKIIKIPVHIIVMIISLALRFIPTLLEESDRIMKAQASRGVDFQNGKFSEKIKAIISLIIPLFISSIQRSSDLADAMEVRGYDPDAKRTRYRIMKMYSRDYISLIIMILMFLFIITLMILNINIYPWVI